MSRDEVLDYLESALGQQCAIPISHGAQQQALAAACTVFSLTGGATLFEQGTEPVAIYIIVTGVLGVFTAAVGGEETCIRRMGAGEVVGEIGFLTGEPRTATVRALRNTEVLCISRQGVEQAALRDPTILRSLSATIARRFRSLERTKRISSPPRTICVVPASGDVDIGLPLREIASALEVFGEVVIVTKDAAEGRTGAWFSEIEKTHDYVLFGGSTGDVAWTRFCLRQSDRALLVAQGEHDACAPAVLVSQRSLIASTPIDLVLLWRSGVDSLQTGRWLKAIAPSAHYHACAPSDFARLARLVVSRGAALVLSGGGARGIAHMGAIQAMRDCGVEIDAIGGTSIGAVAAALCALDVDPRAAAIRCVKAFSQNRLSDLALPRVSLFSERKLERIFGEWFGSTNIEDLTLPFFCISTNLSLCRAETHRSGRLATWLQASCAIPGLFAPVVQDRMIYVDGAVLNNLPVGVARDLNFGVVIGVDVGEDSEPAQHGSWPLTTDADSGSSARIPGMIELLWRVGMVSSGAATALAPSQCEVLIRPAVRGVGLLAWSRHAEAFAAGYAAVTQDIAGIRAALDTRSDRGRATHISRSRTGVA